MRRIEQIIQSLLICLAGCPVVKIPCIFAVLISLIYTFIIRILDTVYEYRVYAVTKTSKETKVVEGSFRTGDGKSTTAVYGNVRYANGVPDDAKTTPIYVSLFDGNTYIAGKKLDIEGDYNFTNISNGTYRIVADRKRHTSELQSRI